jgi:Skp family chaperone for outer membrane proteins
MNWQLTLSVFLGTLPLLGIMAWNLMDVKALRAEMRSEFQQIRSELQQIRNELLQIRNELALLRERVAILEERDRQHQG